MFKRKPSKQEQLDNLVDDITELYWNIDDKMNEINNTINDLFTYLEVSRIDVDIETGIGKVVSIRKKGKK